MIKVFSIIRYTIIEKNVSIPFVNRLLIYRYDEIFCNLCKTGSAICWSVCRTYIYIICAFANGSITFDSTIVNVVLNRPTIVVIFKVILHDKWEGLCCLQQSLTSFLHNSFLCRWK